MRSVKSLSSAALFRIRLMVHGGGLRFPHNCAPNPKDSDVYLVSFPKSGNTWFRYLLYYALNTQAKSTDLIEMAHYLPSVNLQHDILQMLNPNAPCNQMPHRIIKNHAAYSPDLGVSNIIYIVRDGRDALTSYWYFTNQRDRTNVPMNQFLKNSHQYGPWKEHVLGWMNAPMEKRLLIRYEDLLEDPRPGLRAALDMLGISYTDAVVDQAAQKSSFQNLKKQEQSKGLGLDQLQTVKFFRKGKTGSWKEDFGEGDLELFNQYHGGPLPEYGYEW